MAASEARLRANHKYQTEKTDEIKVRVPKGEKAEIQEHAQGRGESTNAFICRAIHEAMGRDNSAEN